MIRQYNAGALTTSVLRIPAHQKTAGTMAGGCVAEQLWLF